MSKLFHDMQEAARQSEAGSGNGQVLAQLLESVGANPDSLRESASPLGNCRRLQLPALPRPFLMANDESTWTHGAFEGYRALRTKLVRFQSSQGVRSIVITSAEAGEGKTVSAVNLALSMSQLAGQRVLLVDADLRTAGLSSATGALEKPGLAEVLAGEAEFAAAPAQTNIPNLYIVGAGEANRPAADLFAGPKLRDFISWCNETFSMVLVDCPPMMGLSDFEVVSAACDGVLLVVRAQRTRRDRLADLVPHLREKKLLGILFNGQERPHHKQRYGYYYSKIGKNRPS